MGLGHAPSGAWVVLALLALMGAVIATSSWLVMKEVG
jgi:cytochrome b